MSTTNPTSHSDSCNQQQHVVFNSNSDISILSILDDKNKEIQQLHKQVANQKIQLTYYLKQRIGDAEIAKLAENCIKNPHEISIPLNLALGRFYKQIGCKTIGLKLYDRMVDIDKKVSVTLQAQESVLRKIINAWCEFARKAKLENEANFGFFNFITHAHQLDFFADLLNCTANLSQKLQLFRLSSNRLLIMEEEKNTIVEQVYSMPIEQRLNCNYLIGMQMEKNELKTEMKQILAAQSYLRERVVDLSLEQSNIREVQERFSSWNNEEHYLKEILKQVNYDALKLLEKTQNKRDREEKQIAATKSNSVDLNKILHYIKYAFDDKDEKALLSECIENNSEAKLLSAIGDEIRKEKTKLSDKFSCELNEKLTEFGKIMNRVDGIQQEKTQLKNTLLHLQRELKEIKLEKNSEIRRLRRQCELYYRQVNDLETIRSAYQQLVEKQYDSTILERNFQQQLEMKNKEIFELTRKNEYMEEHRRYQSQIIVTQNSQLEYLQAMNEKLKSSLLEIEEEEQPYVMQKNKCEQISLNESPPMFVASSYSDTFENVIQLETIESGKSMHFNNSEMDDVSDNNSLEEYQLGTVDIYPGITKNGNTDQTFLQSDGDIIIGAQSEILVASLSNDSESLIRLLEAARAKVLSETELMKDSSCETIAEFCAKIEKKKQYLDNLPL